MNKQEIFNIVYKGLASQGWEQSHNGIGCRYRHGDLKCAAGHLIPDELYHEDMERKRFVDEIFKPVYKYIGAIEGTVEGDSLIMFVNNMQNLHDMRKSPELMREDFIQFACYHLLEIPSCN